VAELAQRQGHEIVSIVTSSSNEAWERADVMIDFSLGESVFSHIEACIEANKPLIVGATGWEDQLQAAQIAVEKSTIGCLYSPNFSIGILIFKQIASYASLLLQQFPEYALSGLEIHHDQKKDAPSGTAKALQAEILKNLPRLTEMPFASLRTGQFPGTHTLFLDSYCDTITLTHEARNRQGFAEGALLAAEWIIGKQGFYHFENILT
jgi:4-hydroxy-tetrahydrodipicolinate reductase